MRVIQARSPFFIRVDNSTDTSKTLSRAEANVYVWRVNIVGGMDTSTRPTTPQYSLRKDVVGSNPYSVFEISELVRDFITDNFNGTYANDLYNVQVETTAFFTDNTTATATYTYHALDGYEAFGDGMQYEDGTTSTYSEGQYLGSGVLVSPNTYEIYGVDNVPFCVPRFLNGGIDYLEVSDNVSTFSYTVGDTTTSFNIRRDLRYDRRDVYKIVFRNKNGIFENLYASRRNTESLNLNNDSYYRNIVNYDTMSYDPTRHSMYKYNVKGVKDIDLNTAFVPEGINRLVEEMFLSEEVWIQNVTQASSPVIPVLLKDKQFTYKTHQNDKLVQYMFKFEHSNRVTNTIR